MNSLVTYLQEHKNPLLDLPLYCNLFYSSILFDGEAQVQCTGAGVEAAQENGRTCTSIDTYYSGENLIYSTA
jgi:hypothetical protein